MNNDELNIRELYNNILTEWATVNGNIITKNVKIPSNMSNPDKVKFDGASYDYNQGGRPFSFIGEGSDVIAYINDNDGTHIYIFNGLKNASSNPSNIKSILKDYGVSIHGKLTPSVLDYYSETQKSGILGETRTNTRSGRIWKSLPSKSLGKNFTVIAFWCREKDVRPEDLKNLKKYFKVGDIFWVATDSKNFNFYGDDYQKTESGEIKELKSKIDPKLTHEEIVDILMRAHTGFKMTPFEKKIVWEFRGFDPSEVKTITGGYSTPAEYQYRSRMSESVEKELE